MSIRYGCLQEGWPALAEIWQRRSPCRLSPLLVAGRVERRLPRTRRESEEALPVEAGLLPDPLFQRRVDSEGCRRDQLCVEEGRDSRSGGRERKWQDHHGPIAGQTDRSHGWHCLF